MPNQEASTVAKLFVDEFISRFGVPLEVHTDQGRNFESSLFKQMCDLFRIHKTRTTSFRPQANGTVERFNRTLTNMLTAYCSKTQNLWDNYLSQVMMAYRSTTHSSTKMTPNMMVLGHDIYMPSQAFLPRPEAYDSISIDEHVKNLQEALADAHDTARKFLREQSIYRKKIYDRSSKSKEFKLHSPIWLHDPVRRPRVCTKLSNKWKGPYLTEKRIDDLTYLVRVSPSKPLKAIHVDRMLPYKGRSLPKWMVPLVNTV